MRRFLEWDIDSLGPHPRARLITDKGFLEALRKFVPKEGNDWTKAISAVVYPGKEIKPHEHPEWTALFYVDPAGIPIITDGPYLPEVGEVLVLEPGVKHSVPKNTSDRNRVSLAMLVCK